jgi:potassium-transporting ATPase KdpC subunit
MMQKLMVAIRTTLVLWVLTALIYPGLMLLVGQGIFPDQANGQDRGFSPDRSDLQ